MTPDEQHIADLMRLHTELGRKVDAEQLRASEDDAIVSALARLTDLIAKVEAAKEHIARIDAPYRTAVAALEEQRADVLDRITDSWETDLGEVKNYVTDDGHEKITAQFRITRSIEIVDAVKIVDVLIANKKVAEGVKTFDKKFLRKLKDVGLLDDHAATYTKKRNVNIHVEVIE